MSNWLMKKGKSILMKIRSRKEGGIMVRYWMECEGIVQGVGFRYFVYQTANRLGLTGYVRNLENGRVEIEVQGGESALAQFQNRLRQGNGYSSIDHLSIRPIAVRPTERAFEIE